MKGTAALRSVWTFIWALAKHWFAGRDLPTLVLSSRPGGCCSSRAQRRSTPSTSLLRLSCEVPPATQTLLDEMMACFTRSMNCNFLSCFLCSPYCSTAFGFVVLRRKFSIILPVCYLFCVRSSGRVSTKLRSRLWNSAMWYRWKKSCTWDGAKTLEVMGYTWYKLPTLTGELRISSINNQPPPTKKNGTSPEIRPY